MNSPATTPAQPTRMSKLPGIKVLLEGPAGTGKTYSVSTLFEVPGIKRVVYFAFEQGTESLLGVWADRGKPVPEGLHICTVHAANAGWEDMAAMAKMANTVSYESLKKAVDSKRNLYNQYEKFLRQFNDVVTDAGVHLGNVSDWGTDTALVIDGMTGLGDAVMKTIIGGKADRDQKDWGLAQNFLENFMRKSTSELRCHFVVQGHIDRETDPVLGGSKITIATLGKALAPKIPPMFSDVILTERLAGPKWVWNTENPQADLKARNLPFASGQPPSFVPLLVKWEKRGGAYEA